MHCFALAWWNYCNYEDIPFVDNANNDKWVSVNVNEDVATVSPVELDENIVPDVTGMNATDAVFLLENMGWRVTFGGFGMVKSQSVKPGVELKKGSVINLVLKTK